jgi:hypothetical protein
MPFRRPAARYALNLISITLTVCEARHQFGRRNKC